MIKKTLFISTLFLLYSINIHAQNAKTKYFLVELYVDSSLQKLDTTKHEVMLYSQSKKYTVEKKEDKLFCTKKIKPNKELLLSIAGNQIKVRLTSQALRNKFIVLKIYVNPSVINKEDVLLTVKSADVIYLLNKCNGNCHRLEIVHPKTVSGSNNEPTTGYKILDKYIFE
jgi:hypothetical protein